MLSDSERNNFLVNLIDRLTPLNNEWRVTSDPLTKIELMWDIGHEINLAVKDSGFGFDELLRTLYDPHGRKVTYITRDLGSYSHRIYVYFNNKEDIRQQLEGLSSYTLFREAFPLLTNDKYKLSKQQKSDVINKIINHKDVQSTQKELKKLKQSIRPIKNTRTTKAQQYSDESAWLAGVRDEIVSYYKETEEFSPSTFPVDSHDIDELKSIILAIAYDKKPDGNKNIEIKDDNMRKIAVIANSTNADKSRFKKWGLDTYKLMTLAEMLSATTSKEKYNFVRKKIISN